MTMGYLSKTVSDALDRSRVHGEIVTLRNPEPTVIDELHDVCSDFNEGVMAYPGAPYVFEFMGLDWRVHVEVSK